MLLKFSHTLPLPGPAYHSPCRGGDNTPDWSTGRVCLCVCVYEVLPLLFSLWVPTPSSLFLCAYALILWSGLSHSSQSRREGEKRRRERRRRERRRYGKEKQADYSPDASTQAEIFFPSLLLQKDILALEHGGVLSSSLGSRLSSSPVPSFSIVFLSLFRIPPPSPNHFLPSSPSLPLICKYHYLCRCTLYLCRC